MIWEFQLHPELINMHLGTIGCMTIHSKKVYGDLISNKLPKSSLINK